MKVLHRIGGPSVSYMLLCLFMIIWLGADFFDSFVHGRTLQMRLSGHVEFAESPIYFVFLVLVKIVIFGCCALYAYEYVANALKNTSISKRR